MEYTVVTNRTYAERKALGIVRFSSDLRDSELQVFARLSKRYGITRTWAIVQSLAFVGRCLDALEAGKELPKTSDLLRRFENAPYQRKLIPNELARPHGRRKTVQLTIPWPTK
jgi:hypothetical protein